METAAPAEGAAVLETTVGAQAEISAAPSGPASGFVTTSRAAGGSGYGADSLLAVRYGRHEGYERVVLDLGSGQRPARTMPRWTLVNPGGDGLLRVELPSVSATTVSDGELGGTLERFYVVRAPEGGLFVEIFSRREFSYQVTELKDPARLVVDFEPADTSPEMPMPVEGGNTVLLEPRAGSGVADPLTVRGYSRNPEAINSILLSCPGEGVIGRRAVRSNDWAATWGYFETTLDLPPFKGRCILRVGARSARDGSFEGVVVPVVGGR